MIKKIPFFFILILLFITQTTCTKKQSAVKREAIESQHIQIKQTNSYHYVSIESRDNFNDFEQTVSQFFQEIQEQQIIPTGPIFIAIYENSPENAGKITWEIGCPTAEGTMVKEPLQVKEWPFHEVASIMYAGHILEAPQITREIQTLIRQKKLSYSNPAVYRLLSREPNADSLIMATLNMEVWIPIRTARSISE